MGNTLDGDYQEIHQELLWMIENYGLVAVLENFSKLPINGHLAIAEHEKLKKLAIYLNFAADTASDREGC